MSSPSTRPDRQPVTLPDTWTETLSSDAGVRYQISVAVPKSDAPANGFPVVFILDATASFATVTETHRRLSRRPDATGVGPAIIVGIGHDTTALYDTALRQRDFTPDEAARGGANGGAAEFLHFIQSQVQPLIEAEFPVDPNRQILAGHSLAAFFTLWALSVQPESFNGYIALSPSLWWDPELLKRLATLPALPPVCSVYLAVGQWEQQLAPWQHGQPGSEEILQRREERKMVSLVEECGRVLATKLPEPALQCQVFADEDHASVFAIGISKALRMML